MNMKIIARYHLKFLLKNLTEPFLFEVDEETWERLRHLLAIYEDIESPIPFFCFSTVDGYQIGISIKDIQMMHFLWEHNLEDIGDLSAKEFFLSADPDEEDKRAQVRIYFRGREQSFESYSSDPERLGVAWLQFELLVQENLNAFISFPDEDDEVVSFQARHVLLFIVHDSQLSYEDILSDDLGDDA